LSNNFLLVKRYYNREIKFYFAKKDILVEPTFIRDNQIWLRNSTEKAQKGCAIYDHYTVKVNFNHFTSTPELVVSYDRKAKVLKKSVAAFLSDNDEATADVLNRVVYIEYFTQGKKKTTKRHITKYSRLNEKEDVVIDYNNVFPIVGRSLAAFLGFDDDEEESTNPFQRKNRYTKYWSKINGFYTQFLSNADFRAIVPITTNGFDATNPMQIGKASTQSKQLIFGKNSVDVIPQRGVNNGPFRQPRYNNSNVFHCSQTPFSAHNPPCRLFAERLQELFQRVNALY
jgi:hypothetical protein